MSSYDQKLNKQLQELYQFLDSFVAPNNGGFERHFIFWVIRKWSNECFFVEEIKDAGHDCSFYPEETGYFLYERIKHYKEFINANTGATIATNDAGYGTTCETYSDLLFEFYGEVLQQTAIDYIQTNKWRLPDSPFFSEFEDSAEGYMDMVYCEKCEDEKILELCQAIVCDFGCSGSKLEPYLCFPDCSDVGLTDNYEITQYSDLTLMDFRKLALV